MDEDLKWFRCELLDRETDELVGYFICLAPQANGQNSAVSRYYEDRDEAYVDQVEACDDPTIPNDYNRTAALREEIDTLKDLHHQQHQEVKAANEARARAEAELETAKALIEALKREFREMARVLVTASHVALSVSRE